jgi:hypothetical protein
MSETPFERSKTFTTKAAEIVTERLKALASGRQYPKTLCPSEVARSFQASELQELNVKSWRDMMAPIRTLCFELRDQGLFDVLQRGEILPSDITEGDVRGPIRIRSRVG